MKVALVGPPGSGKEDLALKISGGRHWIADLVEEDGTVLDYSEEPLAMGKWADYRTELLVATHRMIDMASTPPWNGVYLRTLIDSVAYSGAQLLRAIDQNRPDIEQWFITSQAISMMYLDTYNADVTVWLPPKIDPEDEFFKILAEIELKVVQESGIEWFEHEDDETTLVKLQDLMKIHPSNSSFGLGGLV